jgi:hypothetical protein
VFVSTGGAGWPVIWQLSEVAAKNAPMIHKSVILFIGGDLFLDG